MKLGFYLGYWTVAEGSESLLATVQAVRRR